MICSSSFEHTVCENSYAAARIICAPHERQVRKERSPCQFLHFLEKSENGEKVSGERVAPNKQALAAQLRKERINAGAIREKGKEFAMPTFGSGKVKTKEIAIFFRQFSVMIDAGLPLVQCLEILAANQENQAFQRRSRACGPR